MAEIGASITALPQRGPPGSRAPSHNDLAAVSDTSVASALRSKARLVIVEAPAGCGKTHQGADYAGEAAGQTGHGRVLILAHNHPGCDVFPRRTRDVT